MPVPDAPVAWVDLEPVGVDLGCALGCATEVSLGQVDVPFGAAGDRTGRARMDPTEQQLVGRGLQLDGPAPGLAVDFARWGPVTIDAAAVVGARRPERVVAGEVGAVGVASRAAVALGDVGLGASTWWSGADRAWAVDLAVDGGRFRFDAEWSRQSIGDVRRAFSDAVSAQRVRGHEAALAVDARVAPRWAVDGDLGGAVFVVRREVGAAWLRGAVGLSTTAQPGVRWTVAEAAATTPLDGTPTDLRVSTRLIARR